MKNVQIENLLLKQIIDSSKDHITVDLLVQNGELLTNAFISSDGRTYQRSEQTVGWEKDIPNHNIRDLIRWLTEKYPVVAQQLFWNEFRFWAGGRLTAPEIDQYQEFLDYLAKGKVDLDEIRRITTEFKISYNLNRTQTESGAFDKAIEDLTKKLKETKVIPKVIKNLVANQIENGDEIMDEVAKELTIETNLDSDGIGKVLGAVSNLEEFRNRPKDKDEAVAYITKLCLKTWKDKFQTSEERRHGIPQQLIDKFRHINQILPQFNLNPLNQQNEFTNIRAGLVGEYGTWGNAIDNYKFEIELAYRKLPFEIIEVGIRHADFHQDTDNLDKYIYHHASAMSTW
jgi:hypothetical protein